MPEIGTIRAKLRDGNAGVGTDVMGGLAAGYRCQAIAVVMDGGASRLPLQGDAGRLVNGVGGRAGFAERNVMRPGNGERSIFIMICIGIH